MCQYRNGVVACLYRHPADRKRRDENSTARFCVPAAIRVPIPFRGSANVERVPRTFGNLLLVEAFGALIRLGQLSGDAQILRQHSRQDILAALTAAAIRRLSLRRARGAGFSVWLRFQLWAELVRPTTL